VFECRKFCQMAIMMGEPTCHCCEGRICEAHPDLPWQHFTEHASCRFAGVEVRRRQCRARHVASQVWRSP